MKTTPKLLDRKAKAHNAEAARLKKRAAAEKAKAKKTKTRAKVLRRKIALRDKAK